MQTKLRAWKQRCGVPTMRKSGCNCSINYQNYYALNYDMPLVRSNQVAYYAANAAFVFKEGKQRADYEEALPDLVKFYRSLRNMSDIPFDADRAARLERMVDHPSRTSEASTRRSCARAGGIAVGDL